MAVVTSSRVPDLSTVTTADGASRLASTNPVGTLQSLAQYERERQASNGTPRPAQNALTALVGGAQGGTALKLGLNRVTTVASAADSVQLPAAVAGCPEVVVINAAAANATAVFPQTGEVINALSANASISLVANKTIIFFCALTGTWNSVLTA